MGFFQHLISNDELVVDSIVVAGFLVLIFLMGSSLYALLLDHSSWSPLQFGGAASSVIGSMAAGKTLRNAFSPQMPLPPTAPPPATAAKPDGEG